jgi:hypothetical protein
MQGRRTISTTTDCTPLLSMSSGFKTVQEADKWAFAFLTESSQMLKELGCENLNQLFEPADRGQRRKVPRYWSGGEHTSSLSYLDLIDLLKSVRGGGGGSARWMKLTAQLLSCEYIATGSHIRFLSCFPDSFLIPFYLQAVHIQ